MNLASVIIMSLFFCGTSAKLPGDFNGVLVVSGDTICSVTSSWNGEVLLLENEGDFQEVLFWENGSYYDWCYSVMMSLSQVQPDNPSDLPKSYNADIYLRDDAGNWPSSPSITGVIK